MPRVASADPLWPLRGHLPLKGGEKAPRMTPAIAADILALFAERGAEIVDLPVLQPADPFLDMAGEDLRRRIFLTESETGESLCLRPEFTIPVCIGHIASHAATPRRYAYLGEVFRQRRDGENEFFQAGIEDLGDAEIAQADARSVADAHRNLVRDETAATQPPIVEFLRPDGDGPPGFRAGTGRAGYACRGSGTARRER